VIPRVQECSHLRGRVDKTVDKIRAATPLKSDRVARTTSPTGRVIRTAAKLIRKRIRTRGKKCEFAAPYKSLHSHIAPKKDRVSAKMRCAPRILCELSFMLLGMASEDFLFVTPCESDVKVTNGSASREQLGDGPPTDHRRRVGPAGVNWRFSQALLLAGLWSLLHTPNGCTSGCP
jgi:hypothetical protein